MALKFRRRQKLFPGVYLNFSSKGISTTFGVKGLSMNFNKSGTFLNTGIPGTGLYDRKKLGRPNQSSNKNILDQMEKYPNDEQNLFLPKKFKGDIKSKEANELTSQGLIHLKETLIAAYEEKRDIEKELIELEKKVKKAKVVRMIAKILILGFVIKWFEDNYNEKVEYFDELKNQLNNCKVHLDIELSKNKREQYKTLKNAFYKLTQSQKIWDMTSELENTDNRSSASQSITRVETTIGLKSLPFLNAEYKAMFFENKNGCNIYVYPGFVALFDDEQNFGLVELKDLYIKYSDSSFLEELRVPSDAQIVGRTWAKVNKNGTPDKRFKDNYEIPIAKYGELKFNSSTGIYEVFLFSNAEAGRIFGEEYEKYK